MENDPPLLFTIRGTKWVSVLGHGVLMAHLYLLHRTRIAKGVVSIVNMLLPSCIRITLLIWPVLIAESGSVAYSFQLRVMERPEKQTTAIPFQMPMGEHIVSLAQPSQENR